MKWLVVLAVLGFAAGAKIKCMVGKAGAEKETECTSAEETKCSQPMFVEFTGLSAGVEYKCGACAAETKGKTCEECTGSATAGCNKAKEVGVNFNCYDYKWNATAKAFAAAANATVCQRLKTTSIACSMPKVNATDKTYTAKTGCGNCTKTDTHCEACGKDKCNIKSNAVRAAFLIAPLLAVFYNLI